MTGGGIDLAGHFEECCPVAGCGRDDGCWTQAAVLKGAGMKKLRSLMVGFVLISAISVPIKTQASPGNSSLDKGTAEIGVQFGATEVLPAYEPYLGYFLTDNLEMGGSFLYSTGEVEDVDVSATGFDFWGRYFFRDVILGGFYPFAEGGFQYLKVKHGSGASEISVKGQRFTFAFGGKYFINSRVAAELKLSYKTGEVENLDASGFKFSGGFSVFFGN